MADGDDGNINFKLDLDSDDMVEGLAKIQEQISGLGESDSLSGLVDGLTEAGKLVGVVGVAFLALKTALDSTLDAEKIENINKQFESMAANLGMVGSELKEGLVSSAGGLVNETDLLAAANKAMIELGGAAKDLPGVMDLAKKATVVFGGDVTANFERINQAISTGSTRRLKDIGLTVDSQAAYEKYAESIGATAGTLDQAGKQQAIMNAVLAAGADRFKDVNGSALQATTAWKQLKVVLSELGEMFTLVFDSIVGPTVKRFLAYTLDATKSAKNFFKSMFGNDQQKAEAGLESTNKLLQEHQAVLADLEKRKASFTDPALIEAINKQIERESKTIEGLTGKVDTYKKAIDQVNDKAPKPSEAPQDSGIDKKKQAQEETKFQQELVKIHEDAMKSKLAATKSYAEQERLSLAEIGVEEEKYAAKVKQIQSSLTLTNSQKNQLIEAEEQAHQAKLEQMEMKNLQDKQKHVEEQMSMTSSLTRFEELSEQQLAVVQQQHAMQVQMIKENAAISDEQKRKQELQLEEQYHEQLLQLEQKNEAQREQVIQRWVNASDNAATQFARGFASASMKGQADLISFGQQGAMVANSLSSHLGDAFQKMGAGAKSGSQVMKGALFGMLADIAQQYGATMLLAGLFPPNPLLLAGGAALEALSGYLRSQAGSMGGSVSSAGGGFSAGGAGGASGGPLSVASTDAQSQSVGQNQTQAKSVTIAVQGNIFDTDATRTRMAELVRQSMDSTNFSIQNVGGGIG